MTILDPRNKRYWTSLTGCPRLFLAPMEGLGDVCFRKAMTRIGGFDEACTEFIRVPKNACIPSLLKRFNPRDTAPIPQAVQVMGENPSLLAEMTVALEERGAHRVDLNCGCPSNKVVGKGAGSSLLATPERLYDIAKAMVDSVEIPVTAKLRSGYTDISLFRENLLAAQESGISFLTLHPRTKLDGYTPPARWDLIAEAKELLDIPVVGSGDILTVSDARRMLAETGCDGLMIGRGAVTNPWIFHEILSDFSKQPSPKNWDDSEDFIRHFSDLMIPTFKERNRINKLKQLINYLFKENDILHESLKGLLRSKPDTPEQYLEMIITQWRQGYTV
ncbi:MAG: tRNA-dihydrouridine synthase C [Halioglobus sp.]|jgi:tRNA-dihydrouridine synthase C